MKIREVLLMIVLLTTFYSTAQINVGSGTATNHNLPVSTAKEYSYSQFIYHTANINNSGVITGVKFFKGGSDLANADNWDVYIGATTMNGFLTNTSWVSLNDMIQVFSGTVTQNSLGEVEITFGTPFIYNGIDNIVIAIDENSPGSLSSGNAFYGTAYTGNRGILFTENGITNNPNPLNPPPATVVNGGLKNTIPNITFLGLTNNCNIPKSVIYTQTFDSYIPNCWQEKEGVLTSSGVNFTNTTTSDWAGYASGGIGSSTDQALINMSSTFKQEWLISPSFDLGTSAHLLSFDLGMEAVGGSPTPIILDADDSISLVISLDNGATWLPSNIIHTITAGSEPLETGTRYTIDLSPYSGVVKFAFYARSTAYITPKAVWLDNFFIEPSSSCVKPLNLSSSAITATTATLNWTGTAANYQVSYGMNGTQPGNGTLILTSSTSSNLSGLSAGTTYQLYVRSICNPGDTSVWSDPILFTTTCGPSIIPSYSQNFDTYLPNCWEEKQGTLGTVNTTFAAANSSLWTHEDFAKMGLSSAAAMALQVTSNRREEWLISPSFDLGSSNNFQVEFEVALTAWSDTSSVLFDNDDTLAFVISTDNGMTWHTGNIIETWNDASMPSNVGTFVNYDLSSYSGLVKFGFYVASSTTTGFVAKKVFIDNFKIIPSPTCNQPESYTLTNVSSSSVDIDWALPTTSGIKIEYGPTGFVPGTGSVVFATSAPHTLNNLLPETTYDIYLQNICAAGDTSSQSSVRNFTTMCGSIIPSYYQDFSVYIPNCWEEKRGKLGAVNTAFEIGSFSNWTQDGFANAGVQGAARMQLSSTSLKEWLISPTFDLGVSNTFDLTFDIALTGYAGGGATTASLGSTDTIAVVISTDNGVTWSQGDILQIWEDGTEPSLTGEAITIDLSSYSGLVKIGFYVAKSASSNNNKVFIDNFRIANASTCSVPSALSVANITHNTADISWTTGGAANALIEYGPDGFSLGTGYTVVASSSPVTLSGLDNLSDYQVYIRDICAVGDTSYYSQVLSFATECPPFYPTYNQNFFTYIPECWTEERGRLGATATNFSSSGLAGWGVGGFGNITNVGATKVTMSQTTAMEWLLTPSIDLGAGTINYLAEFKVAFSNNSNSLPASMDADDTLAFVISTDNGITWSQLNILKTWETGNEPSNTGDYFAADLSSYSGLVKFGFYAASSTGSLAPAAFIDDFRVLPMPSCVTPFDIQLTNLVANSVDIGWTSAAPNAQIEYGPAGFLPGTGTLVTTGNNPYTLTGLVDQTDYDFYVRTICTAGDTSNWTLLNTVTTPCPIFIAPYFEGFDPYPANCWTEAQGNFVNGLLTLTNTNGSTWSQDGFGNVGFSGAAKMWFWLNNHKEWMMSPSIDLGTSGNYRLEFDIAMTNDNNTLQGTFGADDSLFLYISTDDGATWNQADTLAVWYAGKEPSNTGDFISIDLSAYTGVVRFGYYAKSTAVGSDINIYIDNFEIPACPAPFGVNIDTLTATSTTISWDLAAGNTFIEYGPAGFAPGSGTTVYSDSSEILIDGLIPISDYDFYLRDSCGVGNYSRWNGPISFSTPCPNYTPTYSEDFTVFLPQCWEKAQGVLSASNTSLGTPGSFGWTSDGFANNGFSGAARMNITGQGIHEWLISPTIDLGTGSTSYQVDFDLAMTAWANSSIDIMGADDTLALVISTDNGLTWSSNNILKTWTANNPPSNVGDFELVELTPYTGLVCFGFYASSSISGGNVNVYVDNFKVEPIPACQQPLNIFVDQLSDTSVSLSWDIGATHSIIQYGLSGFTIGSGTYTSTTNAADTITGLLPNTTYDVYILDSCGIGDVSLWSGPITITTDCQVITPPYLENFTTYLPSCWSEFDGILGSNNTTILNPFSSNWAADGFGNIGTTGAARIYVYTSGNGTPMHEWLVSPAIDLGNGSTDYRLEFDLALTQYLSSGSSSFDADDSLVLVISLDNGATWDNSNILQTWEMGTEPPNVGDHFEINLSGYTGVVKFGFYATSTASGGSCNAFVDNFEISICSPTYSSINEEVCGSYISPSGMLYTTSGTFSDTIANYIGCDSIITINLTVNSSSNSSVTETRCLSYTSDAGVLYNTSGSFTEVFTNAAGCDSTLTLNLTIITIDNSVSVTNGAELVSNESQVGALYQWLDCNNGNTPIAGATNALFLPSENGEYACQITLDSCAIVTACYTINGVGLNENKARYFSIYPNPNQGQFTIEIEEWTAKTTLVITNTIGQVILEKDLNQNKTKIDLDKVERGLYTLLIINKNGFYSEKFIVE